MSIGWSSGWSGTRRLESTVSRCACARTTRMSCRTTRVRRATSSTSIQSDGRSWRALRTGAITTCASTPSTPVRSWSSRMVVRRYVPHVIEPAAGVGRTVLALLCDAYDEDDIGGEQRTVLRLAPQMAPVKVAVLPLVNKDGQPEKARAIYETAPHPLDGRVRRRRLDREALSPPGRDRHAVGRDGRSPDDGGRHRHAARPRHARAGADFDRPAGGGARPKAGPGRVELGRGGGALGVRRPRSLRGAARGRAASAATSSSGP